MDDAMERTAPVVNDLGELSGRLLVFGGVYSNLQALEQLKNAAEAGGFLPQQVLCTGDIVGYCAQPDVCVQMIRDWGIRSIAGNVEARLRTGAADCGCNFDEGSRCDRLSQQWYPFAQAALSASSIDWMRGLPDHLRFTWCGKRVYMLHGSFFNASEFVFRSTDWAVKQQNFDATGADIILAGHCGLPFAHCETGVCWLNAGVIGMPANDGSPKVWYMTLEPEGVSFRHHTLAYDNARAAQLMVDHRLPRAYSDTLLSGLWDNCDILPAVETAQQGVGIVW